MKASTVNEFSNTQVYVFVISISLFFEKFYFCSSALDLKLFLTPSEYFKTRNRAVLCLWWLVATLSARRRLIRSHINSREIYGGRNSTGTRSVIENVINWTFRNTKRSWEYQHKFLLKSASLACRGTKLCLVGADGRWLINTFYNCRIKINHYFITPVAFCIDFDWLLGIIFNDGFSPRFTKRIMTFLSLSEFMLTWLKCRAIFGNGRENAN